MLDIYTLGKKMDFHRNTYLMLVFKYSIKNVQSVFKTKLESPQLFNARSSLPLNETISKILWVLKSLN